MIGQQLGGRYDIIDRIGGGGMAIVYKAHDILLNRNVAIKVLRQQYVNDEDFIRRFRREAQSAASLSHPNVVSIYDVGQEEDVHYIVMEYVAGSNLKEKISESAPLQVEEAVHISSQICDALDHAHHNQIIHRDIKPHNIMIGKNGRVKVTDFGIARAATASDITQTGSVLGSVHYFSPEHAKGIAQGEKSDIYSLGIVMYQMLTGKLPFLGESPISVALMHLQEPVEDPRKINPLIPQSVENIILKALRKNPEERYMSAKEMLNDLEACLLPDRQSQPKVEFSEEEEEDEERTLVMTAIKEDRPFAELYEAEEKERKRKKIWMWLKPLIWIIVLAALALFAWKGVNHFIDNYIDLPEDVPVPNVINMTLEKATEELSKHKIHVKQPVHEVYDDAIPAGIVIDQSKRDIEVKENSEIELTVSLGVRTVEMPNFVKQKRADAERILLELGVGAAQIEVRMQTDEAAAGEVLEQHPSPGEAINPNNAVITLTVSEGLGTFPMPDLINKTEEEARSILAKHDLILNPDGPTYNTSFVVPKGRVFQQFPANPGEDISAGEEISIWISSGYPENALAPVKDIEVWPSKEGEASTVKIIIRDARGEFRRDPVNITATQIFPVEVIVSEETAATITVLVDDQFFDSFTVNFQDALEQDAQPAGGG